MARDNVSNPSPHPSPFPQGEREQEVVVAGHVCLDLIPSFPQRDEAVRDKTQRDKTTLTPGTLVQIGATTFSTGGVSNTAVALHRLGVPTKFIGKVGNDQFGSLIQNLLSSQSKLLSDGVQVTPGEISSYTYVISPPGVDRMFLHCPGANDTFADADVPYDQLAPAKIFHFGYPPLMKQIRANNGAALVSILRQVKQKGLITSLDLTYPDPQSDAGRINWRGIFQDIAPHLDLFLPSIDELVQMLDRPRFDAIMQTHGHLEIARDLDLNTVAKLAEELLAMGIAIVAIKLGDQGIYLRTSDDLSRMSQLIDKDTWRNRELLAPCFEVTVVGTTGAGDCTIAGFLAALLRNESPEDALTSATATGACCCEKPDATSGVQPWPEIKQRINAGWKQRNPEIAHEEWITQKGMWNGPGDQIKGRVPFN